MLEVNYIMNKPKIKFLKNKSIKLFESKSTNDLSDAWKVAVVKSKELKGDKKAEMIEAANYIKYILTSRKAHLIGEEYHN